MHVISVSFTCVSASQATADVRRVLYRVRRHLRWCRSCGRVAKGDITLVLHIGNLKRTWFIGRTRPFQDVAAVWHSLGKSLVFRGCPAHSTRMINVLRRLVTKTDIVNTL